MSITHGRIKRISPPFLLLVGIILTSRVLWSAEFEFKCPEDLTAKERHEHVKAFMDHCVKEHPDWKIRDVAHYRMKLLAEHNCTQTLENIRRHNQEEDNRPGKAKRYHCTKINGQRYFSSEQSGACEENKLEQGWLNFAFIPSAIVDIKSKSGISEPDGKSIWLRFYLAEPIVDVAGRWKYDFVESLNKFYCGKRETRLVKGTYRLGGKTVYSRPEAEGINETVDPGTLNEKLYNVLCQSR